MCEQLTETQPQYTNMIAALDTTRHELPMIGISPLNESESSLSNLVTLPYTHVYAH